MVTVILDDRAASVIIILCYPKVEVGGLSETLYLCTEVQDVMFQFRLAMRMSSIAIIMLVT
jgi:hypothetical protein